MADMNATNPGIKDSWSLVSFARSHGQMKVAPFVNKETGESFKSCAFINPEDKSDITLVSFSSNLGELTPSQIAEQKDNLQVVLLNSGTYKLCKAGDDAWESVDLGF